MKRILAFILSITMIAGAVPEAAFAYSSSDEAGKPAEIVTSGGERVQVDDTWETRYPYGIFLFADGEASVTEGGDEEVIKLYRLGGTSGRASVCVNYNPGVMQLDEEHVSYGSAAGYGDVEIRVEDTLPVAQYQPVGKPSEPEKTDVQITDSPYTGEDAAGGDRILSVEAGYDGYQWYVLSDGSWQEVEDAVDDTFVVSGDMYEEYDFRCVFTGNGVRYCTDSLKGQVYEKEPDETTEQMPEGIDLCPEQSFSKLEMDPENPYSGYVFAVTFAEGEWVKEIRVSSPEDEAAEAMKIGTFTLVDHEGADIMSESATLTVSVADNEDPEPFTIGFESDVYYADKSDGAARVRLKRTGGDQTMVTVEYSTADGSALAGRDYQTVSGLTAFYAGVDEAVIDVPLINDGITDKNPRSFTISLGEVKGDSGKLCTLENTTAEIYLTGSGRSVSENLATMLYDANAVDASGDIGVADRISAPVEDSVITGDQNVMEGEDLIKGSIEGLDANLMAYSYPGRISFNRSSNENYWTGSAYVAGQGNNDITGWTAGSASGSGWELSGKSPASADLKIPYMSKMYSEFYGTYSFNARLAPDLSLFLYGMEFVYGGATVNSGYGVYKEVSCNPEIIKNGVEKEIAYSENGTLSCNWEVDSNMRGLSLYLRHYDAHDSSSDVYSRIKDGRLTRRKLEGDLYLRIHTANDGEDSSGCIVTAPDGAAQLKSSSGVYDSIRPEVTVVPGAGGVDSDGHLYVGSRIKVSLKNTDSYKPYTGDKLSMALYMTDSSGNIKNGPQIEKEGSDYYVTMVWDSMTQNDMKESYTINLIMTRNQRIDIDVTPSVPRKTGTDGNPTSQIDTTFVDRTWDSFWKSNADSDNRITIGCTDIGTEKSIFSRTISEKYISVSDAKGGGGNPLFSLGSYDNIHYINFNRNPGDCIIYNGRKYNGDEDIWLRVEDLAFGRLCFLYYNEEAKASECVMDTAVNRVELYLDGDGDGRISGSYSTQTGYFRIGDASKDEFIMMLDPDCDYSEINFQPELLDNGRYGEYFLKIYYTMTPRSLTPPIDGDGRAQVLPAFITSVTDQSVYSALTEEQQSYRYILPGVDEKGARTSDNHPMYGAAASAMQYVDVPLGGDHSPVESESDGKGGYKYKWNPSYSGNLIYPFSDPEPIYIEHSLAGDDIPLADAGYDGKGGIVTDAGGKKNLNGYLGSFVANTTVALCVTEQSLTADELKADPRTGEELKIESSEQIRRNAVPDASYLSQMDGGELGNADMDPSETKNTYAEMTPNYGSALNMDTYKMMDYATVVTNKDEVILSISIPVVSFSGKNGDKLTSKLIPKNIKGKNDTKFNELKGLMNSVRDGNAFNKALESSYKKGPGGGKLKSKMMDVTIGVSLVFSWKYDPVKNTYYFREFAGGAYGMLSFKYTCRFAPVPVVYVYFAANVGLTAVTGGTVARTQKERDVAFVTPTRPETVANGKDFGFTTRYKNLSMQFNGKLYFEVLDKKGGKRVPGTRNGFIKSGGGKKLTVALGGKGETEFDREYYIHMVALEETGISYANVIEGVSTELVWGGVKVTPNIMLELGAGVGVEMLKVEACFKYVMTGNIALGGYNEETHERSYGFKSVRIALSVTIRAVCFFFSAETDALGIALNYKAGEGWKWTYTLWGSEADLKEDRGFLHPLEDTSRTQRIYSPGKSGDGASLMAYDADDPTVPFKLSGYNSSVSAFRISDGLALGYDYRVVTVNGENYVVYTYGRKDPAGPLDGTMLVVSRLVSAGGADSVGVVSPLDDLVPTETSVKNEIPYIPVDTDEGGADDGTGDLEFDAWADEDNKTIHVAWVSYSQKGLKGDSPDALSEASGHTVIKEASFDTTKKEGFTPARVISGDTGRRVLMPNLGDGRVTAWVSAEPMDDDEKKEALKSYAKALSAAGFDPESDDPSIAGIGRYRLGMQEALWDGGGRRSSICIRVEGMQEEAEADGHMSPEAEGKPEEEDTAVYEEQVDQESMENAGDEAAVKAAGDTVEGHEDESDTDGTDDTVSENGPDPSAGKTGIIELEDGQTVDNIEVTGSGGGYYAAFTTSEIRFTDSRGNEVQSADEAENILTVRKLFLTAFKAEADEAVISDTVLIRTLYDYDNNESVQDGVYAGGKITAYDSPYFANLRFLNAALGNSLSGQEEEFSLMDEADPEDFLLFEMNGCTYVIRRDSLESITGSSHRGTVIPFFAADTELAGTLESGATSATGRTDVTLGADGEGGLAAVYVSTVQGTTNNALFMSKYDPATGTWGRGSILAMNHMDVYEDAIAGGWDDREISAAFLGEKEDYDGGAMDQFTFAAPRIALGVKGKDDTSGNGGAVPGDAGNRSTLLVLTQGNMSYLKHAEEGGDEYLTIDEEGRGDYPSGTGIYAISYGMGQQTVGDASLSFVKEDFTAGAELYASLSFKNTGDVSIRGSETANQEITVTLGADGEGLPHTRLASWSITKNILPGQRVELSGNLTLPVTLPEGARFSLSVSEGSYYEKTGGIPYTAVISDIYTVESKPELCFEEAEAELVDTENGVVVLGYGDNAVVEVDLLAGNKGNEDVQDVYVQFSYDTGAAAENSDPVFAPLDLSYSSLTVGEEEKLSSLMQDDGKTDLKNGILYLGSMRKGYGRRIKGIFTVSPERCFTGPAVSLGLRVELFSAADTDVSRDSAGLCIAAHGEYNAQNNIFRETIPAAVSFTLAHQLTLSKSSLVRLPISYISATGSKDPIISVTEYPDKEDTDGNEMTRFKRMEQCLSRLYYEEGNCIKGRGNGTVVIRAAKEGSGYIRVMDERTNSYSDIPFTVTSDTPGTDIDTADGRISFFNADGSEYRVDGSGQDWSISTSLKSWGNDNTQPYRGTLARAKNGAYFTIDTEAESIDLYLRGDVEVTSNFGGFEAVMAGSAEGGESFARVTFGSNPRNLVHTVKVRAVIPESVEKGYASLDRIVEHYNGEDGSEMKPADSKPRIYWSRSLPKPGSLLKNRIHICELDVISTIPLSKVTLRGSKGTEVSHVQRRNANCGIYREFWYHMFFWAGGGNGYINVDAVDKNGNHFMQELKVDWWEGKGPGLMDGEEEEPPEEAEDWMSAEFVNDTEPYILLTVKDSAPNEDVMVIGCDAETLLGLAFSDSDLSNDDISALNLKSGKKGDQFRIPVEEDGLYVACGYSYVPQDPGKEEESEYSYYVTREDGTEDLVVPNNDYCYSNHFIVVEGVDTGKDKVPEIADTSELMLKLTAGREAVTVQWADLGARKYILHRIDKNGKDKKKKIGGKKGCIYVDKGCRGSEEYTYYLEAVFAKKENRPAVKSDSLKTALLPVGQVTGVRVDTASVPGTAVISWDEMKDASKYFVYRDGGGQKKPKKIKTVKAPGVTAVDKRFKKLKAGNYEYYVVARVGRRNSEISGRCSVSVNAVP